MPEKHKKDYVVDGARFATLDDAAAEFTRALGLTMPWQGNLDGFNDFSGEVSARRIRASFSFGEALPFRESASATARRSSGWRSVSRTATRRMFRSCSSALQPLGGARARHFSTCSWRLSKITTTLS